VHTDRHIQFLAVCLLLFIAFIQFCLLHSVIGDSIHAQSMLSIYRATFLIHTRTAAESSIFCHSIFHIVTGSVTC